MTHEKQFIVALAGLDNTRGCKSITTQCHGDLNCCSHSELALNSSVPIVNAILSTTDCSPPAVNYTLKCCTSHWLAATSKSSCSDGFNVLVTNLSTIAFYFIFKLYLFAFLYSASLSLASCYSSSNTSLLILSIVRKFLHHCLLVYSSSYVFHLTL